MVVPRLSWFVIASVLAGICASGPNLMGQSKRDAGPWSEDFETATAEAERLGRPLLIHFYADWCLPCRRMDRDVLRSPELAKQFEEVFVGVKVDADRNPKLVKRFGVRSLPADVVVSPEGEVLIQTQGYQERKNYVGRLARLGKRFKPEPTEIGRAEPRERPGQETPGRLRDAARQEKHEAPFDPLPGLDGYSPVSLSTWREWRKGKPEFTAYHQGVAYQMVSEDELNEFSAEPDKYVPRLLGCDPVILQKTDRAVPGDTKYGAYFDGKLYLFQSLETRDEFKKSPMRYVKTRHVLKADEIERGVIRQSEKPAGPTDPVRQ